MKDKLNQIIGLAKKNESATFTAGDKIYTLLSSTMAGIDAESEPDKISCWYIQDELSFKLIAELKSLETFEAWALENKLLIGDIQK